MRKTLKFAVALLLAVLIGTSGAAALFAGQTTTALAQGETMKAAGAEAAPQTAQEKQEKEKALQAQVEQQKAFLAERKAEAERTTPIVKTYSLKYISATEFMRSARFYVAEYSGTESSLTVRIAPKNIPDFEALLKKLDVEKKNIQFQVYAIVAAKEDLPKAYEDFAKNETKEITDKDLKRVLDEMKGLWNFKHYWIDSPSFLIAKDGSGSNRSKLVSRHDLELVLRNIQLRGDEPGKRIVSVGEIALTQKRGDSSQGSIVDNLINTSDITLKEKGYLVVGVSGLEAWAGLALILVISAEIK